MSRRTRNGHVSLHERLVFMPMAFTFRCKARDFQVFKG